jgi:hypothetical protein
MKSNNYKNFRLNSRKLSASIPALKPKFPILNPNSQAPMLTTLVSKVHLKITSIKRIMWAAQPLLNFSLLTEELRRQKMKKMTLDDIFTIIIISLNIKMEVING